MDARSSLIVIDAEVVGSLPRSPAGADQHFVAFSVVGAADRSLHFGGLYLVTFFCSDVQNRGGPQYQFLERNFVQGPGKLWVRLQWRVVKRISLVGNHKRAARLSIELHPCHTKAMLVIEHIL